MGLNFSRGKVFKKEAIGGFGSIVVAFIGVLINYAKIAFSGSP